ncbi:MAG: PCMD domain-containing protein [Muribaculaceae bacterium]|nr:PCMD domain-containing protein [Muribaculaceae bacterium]
MKKIFHIATAAVICVIAFCGCIKNDIPYPRIQANFLTFEVDGENKATLIDSTNRVITVYLEETTDIRNVRVTSYSVTAGARVISPDLSEPLDMTGTLSAIVSLYQDYVWTINAQQDIERYFTVSNQMGSSTIDVPARRIVANIPASQPLDKVKVLSMKLGPEGSVTTPDLAGQTVNFTNPVTVEVTNHGYTEEWTIYINQNKETVRTMSADAWTCVAWVYGEAEAGKDNGVEYRKADSDEWIKAPAEWVTHNGGSFHARLIHLEPLTEYVARAYSDDDKGAEIEFTTGITLQVPNSDFNAWWLDGKVWCPWPEDGTQIWDSGNKGATTLGTSNTFPSEDTPSGSGLAAQLETRFVGIGIIGKLAAGNIFTGKYVATDGTNGILSFGQPFTERPTRLRGYLKYNCAPISSVTTGFESLKGQPDTCIVWIALSDASEPYTIRTNPKNQSLFSPDDPSVVAYGNIQYGSSVNSYIPFDIELDYRSTSRVPKYIVIVASASKYGDYFTGGNGSCLWVDDLELLYDY